MMPLTVSLPLVLADADAAVVAEMASAIPAASSVPVTFDSMVPPEQLVLLTIAERRTRRASENTGLDTGLPGCGLLAAPGNHVALCSSGGVSQLRPGVRHACRPHAEGPKTSGLH